MKRDQAFTEKVYGVNIGGPDKCRNIMIHSEYGQYI